MEKVQYRHKTNYHEFIDLVLMLEKHLSRK